MRTICSFGLLFFLLIIISSCNTKKRPQVHFKSRFPDHNRNLTHALPESFKVKYNRADTTNFNITYDQNSGLNYIIDIDNNDTLFYGYAAKYNGLYFLSRPVNDSSYNIHALHTDGYTIKGLHTEALQIRLVNNALNKKLKDLIESQNDRNIVLIPKKETLFPFFKHLLTQLRGDTILHYDLHMNKKN